MFTPFGVANPTDGVATGGFVDAGKVAPAETAAATASKADIQEQAEEAAFTPSVKPAAARKVTPMPTPETAKASSQGNVTGDDVQNKIAALQRQLSDIAKNKA